MGGGLSSDNATRRERQIIFFIVKEANGGSMTAWENQLVSCSTRKTALDHLVRAPTGSRVPVASGLTIDYQPIDGPILLTMSTGMTMTPSSWN